MLGFLSATLILMREFDEIFSELFDLVVLLAKMMLKTIDIFLLLAEIVIHVIVLKFIVFEFALEFVAVILHALNIHLHLIDLVVDLPRPALPVLLRGHEPSHFLPCRFLLASDSEFLLFDLLVFALEIDQVFVPFGDFGILGV